MTLLANPATPRATNSEPNLARDPGTVWRRDFPLLQPDRHGRRVVYLDNGATTQKPRAVIDATAEYYAEHNANIHRGVYRLSQSTTAAFEDARETVARFLNAADPRECIFTRGTTESINLVAASWGRANLKPGDEILLTHLEHHSNIVPWQLVAETTGAIVRVAPINDRGELLMDEFRRLLGPRTKVVAVTHLSNALGTINDVKAIAALAHEVGAIILVDGAQWVAHYPTDVQDLDVDFYAFSGHKLYGPTGIGVLWGRRTLLETMPPYQGGGDMIESVSFEKTTYAPLPNKFEAGTPNVAGVIGLRTAIEYVEAIGFDAIARQESDLLAYATERMGEVPGLRIVGTAARKSCVISFVMEHPCIAALDIGAALDVEDICVRTGHHCCMPLMERLRVPGTVRVSLALYNTRDDIDQCVAALKRLHAQKESETPRCSDVPAAVEPNYPKPFAPSPEDAAERLAEAFESLPDWADRYQYIIDLGKKLLPFPENERTEANRVRGCQATVFLTARKHPGTPEIMDFLADANADIVRGLLVILQRLFSGQKAHDILAFDLDGFLDRIGLSQNLALTRRNGLTEMVRRLRMLAKALVESSKACTNQDCAHCAKADEPVQPLSVRRSE
jgi:cysteine desulfurase/selenocysteine lyase